MTVAGLAAGIAMAMASTRLLSGLLSGVKPSAPVTFVAVGLRLCIVALFAKLASGAQRPARRSNGSLAV